ncbi:MAG: DUF2231 domain-containing protein [Pseudomonadota bacterium]|nr:DUF2231 domain-containing protein [Pseudomonadota bacterium]QKK04264.1 MAG: DUF2231 domain-containing protein [Pseudomonadota bacterium]
MDIELIPNWHPVFVHFTVALLSLSALMYLTGFVLKKENLLVVARWNLWIGAIITVGTVLAGFHAYNTVAHDGPSHAAMTDHRHWALMTASVFGVIALWSLIMHRGAKTVSAAFVLVILLASGLLAITGYKGGEVVYRHGTGVMRLPKVTGDGSHASHKHGEEVRGDEHKSHAHNEEPGNHNAMTEEVDKQPSSDHIDHDHGGATH